ncbi:MAG: hydantoinase/oxoprolinase family protein [Haloglomus sp.]
MSGGMRAGVDVGGTFTDVVTVRDGTVDVRKTPSTPEAPDEGATRGLAAAEGDPADLDFFGHGTTVATNAVLEQEWAETALVTTAGFGDVLEIGRQTRPDLYDLHAERPAPVVPRDRRHEVTERLDERGAVLTPLDEDGVRDVADALDDVESVAVCLLFAYENDAHEKRVRECLREAGVDVPVTLSGHAHAEIREFERTQTTALDAALRPVVERYLERIGGWLDDRSVPAPLTVMASNGGLLAADVAGRRPVRTLLSGPAAGVRGAVHVADRHGYDDVITMDMGGTSCDVSLVADGEPRVTTDVEVGDYTLQTPAVDVHTVGAGGGSVARVDAGGALRVGPVSAGADPGPVCYGRGGTAPTTTDAHAVLGRIRPGRLLEDPADPGTVCDAVREAVADPLGVSVAEAAAGILDVATANMERALRVVSVERGHDPRSFTLVAFGGAGPLHATRLAARLDVPRVLIPRRAGVLSALGLLVSDVLYDHAASRVRRLDAVDPRDVTRAFADLAARGREDLRAAGVDASRQTLERRADLRYVGQTATLTVPVPDDVDEAALATLGDRFHERHERRYGHADRSEPVELVTLRLRARGAVDPPDLAPSDPGGAVADARRETRAVHLDGERRETPVYDRPALPFGCSFDGPAVVEGTESTCLVRPGQRVGVADDGTLVVEVAP